MFQAIYWFLFTSVEKYKQMIRLPKPGPACEDKLQESAHRFLYHTEIQGDKQLPNREKYI